MQFGDRSPQQYARLRQAIAGFRNTYVAYLNDTLPLVHGGGVPAYDERRRALQRLAVRADQAVNASGLVVALAPPPALGGPVLRGVAAIAFAHEDQRWGVIERSFLGGHYKQSYEVVIEALDSADALLEEQEEDARRQRRRPLYWGDRLLRAVLGFPAYLVSLVAGFDRRELSPESARVLWIVSLAADAATIFGFGRLLGWW
jgi:hypothetical protein